jgi:hypothetical protein
MDHTIPPQLSEDQFRLYEPHITKAVKRWPEFTEFPSAMFVGLDGGPIAGTTFSARFKDAITSVLRYGWETTIDVVKLRQITKEYVVADDRATSAVWFRRRVPHSRPSLYTQQSRAMGLLPGGEVNIMEAAPLWKDATDSEVDKLCSLISTGRLVGPYIIDRVLTDADLEVYLGKYAVMFARDVENGRTVIS